jgi:drug/metabolite transporter (DMT)-like permease
MSKTYSSFAVWSVFALLSIVWGSSFILIKKGLEVFSASEVGAIRIGLAGVLMMPIAIMRRPKNVSKYILGFLLVGCSGNLIPAFLFSRAETNISSSLAGMLNAFTPVFALIIWMLMFKSRPNRNQVMGLILGFIGAVVMLYKPNMEGGHLFSVGLVICATFLYGLSVNSVKKFLSDLEPLTAASWSIASVSIFAWIYIIGFTDTFTKLQTVEKAWSSFGFIAILGLVGTAIATILFYELIKVKGSVFSTSVTYVMPIVALAWGFYFMEELHWWQPLAMILILVGVFLINKKRA